jgi:hypothetical protein
MKKRSRRHNKKVVSRVYEMLHDSKRRAWGDHSRWSVLAAPRQWAGVVDMGREKTVMFRTDARGWPIMPARDRSDG